MINPEKLFETLESFEKIDMSLIPTPLHKLDKLNNRLGVNIFCKRDDMTGFAFGGNKTRKLDYLVKDAIDKGYDSIITFGAVQSNWCRMTSAAGAVNDLDVFLVLAGNLPEKATANLMLDKLAGASITYIDSIERDDIISRLNQKMEELKQSGRNPYYLPVGGSVAIGSLGYIRCFAEIMQYSVANNVEFSKIVLASGSAGTQAGMVAAQLICGWEGDIIGMGVSRNSKEQEDNVLKIVIDTLNLSGYSINLKQISSKIIVDDNYLGNGYRFITPDCTEAIEIFARYEGIFLDEVYTGKAAAGLIDYAQSNRISHDENVLFLHTGGSVQLFE